MYKLRIQAASLGIAILVCSGPVFSQSQSQRNDPTNPQGNQRDQGTQSDRRNQGNQGNQSTTSSTSSTTSAANPTTFKDKLVEMNSAEIEIAQMATTKAQDKKVRDYAEMLVRDHTQALDKVEGKQSTSSSTTGRSTDRSADKAGDKAADRSAGATSTSHATIDRSKLTREHQQASDRLSKLSGAEFDREFMEMMVKDHKTAVNLVEKEEKGSDAALAKELLPTLRQHLTQAEQIQKELGAGNKR